MYDDMIDYHYHASSVDSIKRRHAVIRLHVSDNNSNMLNLNVLLLTCAMVALSSSQDARTMQQPLDFIQEVFSNLTKDGEGRPKDLETGPTSVWFLQDTGILNNASEEHNELRPNGDYLFQFDWSSIAKNSNSDLSKGVIRAHFRSQSKSNRTESVSVVMAANVSVGILDDDAPAVPSGGTRFTASGNGSGWIEIEITAGLKAAWYRSNASAVVVSIHLSREDGVTAGGVSVVITDLSAIPLDLRHQNRYAALQPLLLIYLEDGSLKTRAMVLSTGPRIDGTMQEAARARRSDLVGSCGLYNYTVTFSDVGIDFVLTPESMNIGRCSGGCATSNQRSMPAGTVTNHASVIAAADAVQRTSESSSSGQGGVACCSPLKYQPVYLLVFNSDMILRVQLFTDMVVSTCGCG